MRKISLTIISLILSFAVLSASAFAQDIFAPIISRLLSMGILNAMLLFLFAAIIYAVLRKAKIFGDSDVINGVIAFIMAFFIFIFPFLTGISLVNPLSIFFTQSIVIIIFLMIGFIAASFFYPDMPKMLAESFTRRGTLMVMIGLAIGLFVTSGLVTTMIAAFMPPSNTGGGGGQNTGSPPTDVLIIGAGLILFIVVILVAASIGVRGV
jgi:hypothetical protein